MRFEDLARRAGKAVTDQGRRATPQPVDELRATVVRRRAVRMAIGGGMGVIFVVGIAVWARGLPDASLVGSTTSTSVASPSIETTVAATTGTTSTTTAQPEIDAEPPVFTPAVDTLEDGRLELDVTFLDGTTATLNWPSDLDLLSGGVQPDGWGGLDNLGSATSRTFLVLYEQKSAVIARFGGGEVLAEYPDGHGGTVEFRRFPSDTTVDYLIFDMGNWTVLVYDYQAQSEGRMSESDRATWALSLDGEEAPGGFLRLSTEPPLVQAGPNESPPLSLGLISSHGTVGLTPQTCTPSETLRDDGDLLVWCDNSGQIAIRVHTTDPEFAEAVSDSLTISNVEWAISG